MKRFLFFLLFIIGFVNCGKEIEITTLLNYKKGMPGVPIYFDKCFFKLSKGISELITHQDLHKSSKKIINSVVNLTSAIVQDHSLTPDEAQEIECIINYFEIELAKLLPTKGDFDNSYPEPQDNKESKNQLLTEGLNQLLYHIFMLAVFKQDVPYHMKHIISAILKLISYILENKKTEMSEKELAQINRLIRSKFESKILCYVCEK